ncbi:hypothetical protein ACIBJF_38070 [Streptomyces sp. NPDC050743]|uniref:hypothetical protein n=1 Tax=Streptomyces sp. NPDC050743 TaxID=3365634 RepID=UPI0037BC313D
MTDDEVVEAVRRQVLGRVLPPPATPHALAEAEAVIGFPLPLLPRRLYTKVANGGLEAVPGSPDPTGAIPAGLVLLYDWGCTIWSLADFRDATAPMWCTHDGEVRPQGITFAVWLLGTGTGTLTVEKVLETQPARQTAAD